MGMKSAGFVVAAAEYPKLQAACPGEFPFTFEEFMQRVAEGVKMAADQGVTIEPIEVRVDEFLAWCKKQTRKPNNAARAEYVARLLAKRSMN